MNNQVIYITGPDGSGKTTYLKDIEAHYTNHGIEVEHIWIRSPKILSKPLMAYCRLSGLTKYKTIDGVKYGKHEFYKSKFVSYLFPILQLIDFKIKWYSKKRKLKGVKVWLIDRFSIDTLADLMADTNRLNLHHTNIGKAFLKIAPKNSQIILLNVEEAVIRSRKKDTLYDEHLSAKIKVYQILSNDLKLTVVENSSSFEAVKKELYQILNL
jgi:thymidylate kinase